MRSLSLNNLWISATFLKMEGFWSVDDKKKILKIFKKFGARNYNLIHQHMQEKSVEEIKAFCQKYIQLSMRIWERSKANNDGDAALKNWLTVMNKIHSSQMGCLTDVLPRVLKYIALFEKRKGNSCINLDDCYMVLSDFLSGLASKKINDTNSYFFYECLLKLAKSVKHGGNGPSIRYLSYLTNLKVFMKNLEGLKHHKALNIQTKKKSEYSITTNPLCIPNKLLQMSLVEKDATLFD